MMDIDILILGSGLQGAATASILSNLNKDHKIYLADINLTIVEKVAKKIGNNIIPVRINAENIDELIRYIKKVDIVFNFLPPKFNLRVMRASLEGGSYYVDTASGPNEKLETIDKMILKQIRMSDEFSKRGIGALISCGLTPGLSNVIAKKLVHKMNIIDYIKFRVAGKIINRKIDPLLSYFGKYIEILEPTWSPEVTFLYRATRPVIYLNGRYIKKDKFGDPEIYSFPKPIGNTINVLVDHEEPITLPLFLEKDIKYIDYKNPPDIITYGLIKLGFASNKSIQIDDRQIKLRDMLFKIFKKPINLFLTENENNLKKNIPIYREIIIVETLGWQEETRVRYKAVYTEDYPPHDIKKRLERYKLFGTTYISVALPAIIGAKLLVEGDYKGVIAPEKFNPDQFLNEYSKMKKEKINIKIYATYDEYL